MLLGVADIRHHLTLTLSLSHLLQGACERARFVVCKGRYGGELEGGNSKDHRERRDTHDFILLPQIFPSPSVRSLLLETGVWLFHNCEQRSDKGE